MSDVPLSVLDTSLIVEGSNAAQALHHSIDLARAADAAGYHRYWVAEHHGMRGVASCATAVLIGQIAGATTRLRVGAGGILLPNHAPLVIAEQFGTLEVFHPGRIDLALGRAPGGNKASQALVRGWHDRDQLPFPAQVEELLGHFHPDDDATVRAIPAVGNEPTVWLLGSSENSAKLAGAMGLPYAFAHHLRPDKATEAVRLYRNTFTPSARCAAPTVLVSVSVIAADTDDTADWLAGSTRLKVLSRVRGHPILLPSPQTAAARTYTDDDRVEIAARADAVLVGSPDTIEKKLQTVLDDTAADEIMVAGPIYDHAARRHSYELVSELSLVPRACGERPTRVHRATR